MEFWGVVMIIAAAIIIGAAVELFDRSVIAYGAAASAIGAAIGAYLASQRLGSLSDWGTEWWGVRIYPALIGAIVLAVAVEAIYHMVVHPPTAQGGGRSPLAR